MSSSSHRRRKRYYCGHCKDYVSKTLFYQHKRLYFDRKAKKWSKERLYFDGGAHFVSSLASTTTLPDDESGHDSACSEIAGANEMHFDSDADVG